MAPSYDPNPSGERRPAASAKITPGDLVRIRQAVDLLTAHYAPVAAKWPEYPERKRSEYLAACPELSRLIAAIGAFGEVR